MTEQRLWVTAYVSRDREILEAHAGVNPHPLLFEFDRQHVAHAVTKAELDAVRERGCRVNFYSIPDPF